jgi:hypothetical protein
MLQVLRTYRSEAPFQFSPVIVRLGFGLAEQDIQNGVVKELGPFPEAGDKLGGLFAVVNQRSRS